MSAFFVRRPIVAIVIAILTVVLGVVALVGLPIAQFPPILPPQINLTTTYVGADAMAIEQAVATPIEQQMNGVEHMLYQQSTNANDGSMTVVVTFDVDTNLDVDNVLVNNRFAQAQPLLPQDVKNYGVTIKKFLSSTLIAISLVSPDGRYDPAFLANYSRVNVNDALLRVEGVGEIRNLGSADYAMRIWLNPPALARLGLSVADVQSAIRAQNVVNPSGQIGAEPVAAARDVTYTVRSQGRLIEPEQFGDIVLRANPDGSSVKLRDVARVELGSLNYQQYGTYNGAPAAVIAVFQAPGSNALDVVHDVLETMDQLAQRFPPGIEYRVSLDTTASVHAGIREIVITLLEAIALVLVVVFAFLRSWRATLIPLLAVPVSICGAFAAFPLLGFSINTLSLFGLVLAIGLVVDDAIVVVEAVEHHIEAGLDPRDATLKAMSEVQGPVVAIALILAAVFIPVALSAGVTGRLYQQFALTVGVSVLVSAFNALTLSPALAAMWLRPRASGGRGGAAGSRLQRWFERATEGYVSVNRRLLRKLFIPILVLAGSAVLATSLDSKLPSGFIPDEDQGYAIIGVQLPDGASLARTREVFAKVDAILAKQPAVRAYNGIAGYSFFTRTAASYVGTGFVMFRPWEERRGPGLTAAELLRSLNGEFARIPEARVFAVSPPAVPGISATGGFSLMLQDQSGSSYEFLAENVGRFLAEARRRPELAGVRANYAPAVPQLFAEVDRDKVMKQGVAIGDVYAALQTFLGGVYVNDFTQFGRQWRVLLGAEADYRGEADAIRHFHVRNAGGAMVPLSSFVRIRRTTGPEYTVRFNMYRSVEVLGEAAPGFSSGQALEALEDVARNVLPSGMGYAFNALSYQQKLASGGALRVFGLSLLIVFLILAALYESWSLPFSVLLVTPVAAMGAYAGLFARNIDNNVYARVGLIMLIGLSAKNAILIVEFIRTRVRAGQDLIEATLEGARLRLRPILMTSFAFIFGCLPLWFASGAGAAARRTLGTAVVSGATAATLLGIFIVPALFVAIERLTSRKPPRAARGHIAASLGLRAAIVAITTSIGKSRR